MRVQRGLWGEQVRASLQQCIQMAHDLRGRLGHDVGVLKLFPVITNVTCKQHIQNRRQGTTRMDTLTSVVVQLHDVFTLRDGFPTWDVSHVIVLGPVRVSAGNEGYGEKVATRQPGNQAHSHLYVSVRME